tara:strand:- start:1446 stop:1673 length:228 start_codon:yes stop_codon:yes gene_type:complete
MQKLINVLAVSSFVISGAVVCSGVYVYFNRASILDEIKSKVMGSVTESLPDVLSTEGMIPSLPDATGPVLPSSPF